MLFTFNKFWKITTLIIVSWIFYGIWGFEMTVITLLSLIFAKGASTTNTIF